MTFHTVELPLHGAGTITQLHYHSFGPQEGRKVYIQAGLHADEHPGLLVAQRLIARLQSLDAQGLIREPIIVVPFANPIGLNQKVFGHVTGRCDWHTGRNFNRGMGIPPSDYLPALNDKLTDNAEFNSRVLRELLSDTVANRKDLYEINVLHKALLSLSIDAHCMLDLHCDDVALPHLFYGMHQVEQGQRLAQALRYPVCLEEDVTGDVAFDATHTQPWVLAQNAYPEFSFAEPAFAATVELRGSRDVHPDLAEQDARGLLRFLQLEGYLSDDAELADAGQTETWVPERFNVNQVQMVAAPVSGIVTYEVPIGTWVNRGDRICQIERIDQPMPTRVDVIAEHNGYLFAQTGHFMVSPGHTIAMVATHEPMQAAGAQLAF